ERGPEHRGDRDARDRARGPLHDGRRRWLRRRVRERRGRALQPGERITAMQVIIDEIVNNVRMVDRSASALTPEVMRKIIGACLDAVRDMTAKEQRVKEEQSIDGPWSTQPH